MKKAFQRAVVLGVAALGLASFAGGNAKPEQKQATQKLVKLSKEQLKQVSGAGNFCCGNSFKSHDNGGGNDPGRHH